MSTSASQIVTDFLQAFMSGNIDQASSMVREDFSFRAPLRDGMGNKAAYFAGARNKTKFIRAFRILRQWADGNEVSTIYEIDKETTEGGATMAMSEWHTVDAGQLISTFMLFDSSAKAAKLMGGALGDHH